MITMLELKLRYKGKEKLTYHIGSLMHGIIMEKIERDYAEILHESNLKPFSQSINDISENTFIWRICTLTKEAKKQIIDKLFLEDEFFIEYKELKLEVIEKSIKQKTYEHLVEDYYFIEQPRTVQLEFTSPTSFKSHGNYIIMPTVHLIFQSLMLRYDSFSEESQIGSEEIIEHIEKYVHIVGYRLRSVKFSMEGVKIPGFCGMITLRINGPQQLANLIKMLIAYGEYSGIGIKTALGMGSIQIKEERRHDK